jgi:predicted phage terminase large subunit-like protein
MEAEQAESSQVLQEVPQNMAVLTADIRRLMVQRELARRHYAEYLPYVHGKSWVRTKLSTYLANEIQAFIEADTGNAYDIMIIETPPQHGKSISVTETLPSWYFGKYPDKRVIEVSYNSDTAERFGRRNKEKVEAHGQTLFGITLGNITKNSEFNIAVNGANAGGQMLSRGVLSGITGNPANLLIIDDPIKTREEADSKTHRDKVWDEWLNSFKSRLSAGAKVIVIMTPWHEDDLRARIMATETCVKRLRIPVEAEENDPLGRSPGDALCPEIGKDNKWLAQFKASYMACAEGGARAWSALYQCNPRTEGGNIVQRSWWKYYDPNDIKQFATEMISVDATFKDNETNDFVSIQVWGKLESKYYLRYCMNQRMNFPNTVQAILMIRNLFPYARRVLVEDKANGSAIIQTMQKMIPGVIPINPKGGKVSRVNAVSPAIESGNVYLPIGAPWVDDYIEQWCQFPNGKNDDMVDSTSQCLNYMIYSPGLVYEVLPETTEERFARREQDAMLSDALWSPYDRGGSDFF